ncbi:type II toxin-antitoxin system RelE/ParE family toxin [Caballeronia sp. LZ029]|uniref:type II toxin-antitoxin system RelE/ParE family toxin n=1 Tax=Caballeronia sp. LZ029 TaxID=3038564 RepID=UPI0028590370|nr:type II toxin-antitoxin system RelE/ParE family toxin [Caballeronia sp. LZ029]MDR5742788.1 type II toxin-antitoxin system RelE/ParE family toxin [Caballeronia sp. LZ029]
MQHLVLKVRLFRQSSGNEPVREWLSVLDEPDKKAVGADIKTVQIGWPLGMPLVRKLAKHLWEIRIHLHQRIARVLFTVKDGEMVLLHGFIKKSQALPKGDFDLAETRMKEVHDGERHDQETRRQ